MPPESTDPQNPRAAHDLIGQRVLDSWVPTAVAAAGVACNVLRADPVEGESKVLVHVVLGQPGQDLALLRRELEDRRRIRHRGVLQLLMSGILDDGRIVLVTPSNGGTSLASHFAMRPPRLPAVLRMASQVARALQAFHDTSGAYGPLTPEHVLFHPGRDGVEEAQLLPVWWAWRHGFDEDEAAAWQAWRRVDEPHRIADDAFSLGALIWHGVTGRPPMDEDALDTLTGSDPTPLPALSTQVRRRVPGAIDAIVASLLSPDRSARPADLTVVADRLEDVVHQLEGGGPSIAPPMVTATPVPVGSQLRERSLVLPIAPPDAMTEQVEDLPTAPSETRALPGLPMPVPRSRFTAPDDEITLVDQEEDLSEAETTTDTRSPFASDRLARNPQSQVQTAPPSPDRPLDDASQGYDDARYLWLAVGAGVGLVGAAIVLALYLTGLLG